VVTVAIGGRCDAHLRGVRDAFADNFTAHGEVGAAVAVTVDGKLVVDLWAGHADAARTHPWTRDTIVNVASATKGLTAICAHRLVDRGLLDLEAPVATWWPAFAQAGKADLPVHLLLGHRAGLPAIETPLPTEALYDWDTMTGALAAQAPWWEPGTRHGYHVFTFGWLVGEVVRRITDMSLGRYWRQEVAEPLGLDCHIGLAAAYDGRVAEFIPVPPPPAGELGLEEALLKRAGPLTHKALYNPPHAVARHEHPCLGGGGDPGWERPHHRPGPCAGIRGPGLRRTSRRGPGAEPGEHCPGPDRAGQRARCGAVRLADPVRARLRAAARGRQVRVGECRRLWASGRRRFDRLR
jgi:CubicO group peptidase (beta-lactamase class C family)